MHKPTFFLAKLCRRFGWHKPGMALAALAGIFQVYGVVGAVKTVRQLRKELIDNARRNEDA